MRIENVVDSLKTLGLIRQPTRLGRYDWNRVPSSKVRPNVRLVWNSAVDGTYEADRRAIKQGIRTRKAAKVAMWRLKKRLRVGR